MTLNSRLKRLEKQLQANKPAIPRPVVLEDGSYTDWNTGEEVEPVDIDLIVVWE